VLIVKYKVGNILFNNFNDAMKAHHITGGNLESYLTFINEKQIEREKKLKRILKIC